MWVQGKVCKGSEAVCCSFDRGWKKSGGKKKRERIRFSLLRTSRRGPHDVPFGRLKAESLKRRSRRCEGSVYAHAVDEDLESEGEFGLVAHLGFRLSGRDEPVGEV